MKILNLNSSIKIPLYIQLYQEIKELIVNGDLIAEQKLPSKKILMDTYKLSQNTIEGALYLLLEEGYIYSIERKGYFVSNIENLIKKNKKVEREKNILAEEKKIKYDFSYSGVDKKSIPKTIFKKITRNIYDEENSDLLIQGDIQGYYYLREAIAEYLLKSRGVKTSSEQIVVSAGLEYLFYIIFSVLKNHIYGIENPCYKMLPDLFRSSNKVFREINLDRNGIVIETLKANGVNVACVTPSHQFPRGIIMPITRRNELLNWANEREENYIIEDDYDSEFKYNGRPIQALKAIDENDKVIYIGSFSKSVSPAMRVSYMVLPKTLMEIYKENLPYFICPVSTLTQKILYRFLDEGYFTKHLNKMRIIYKKKREVLVSSIKEVATKVLNQELEVQGADAGLHITLKLPEKINFTNLLKDCEENSIKIYSLDEYYITKPNLTYELLLGYASLTKEQITEGITLLMELIKKNML